MGVHYLIIYKDLDTLRTFYTQYTKIQIEKNNEAVLINPFYETADSVRQFIYESIDTKVLEDEIETEKSLMVIDALQSYFGSEPDSRYKERMSIYVTHKIRKKGLSILSDTGAFHFKGKLEELVDYELSLPTISKLPLKRFCIFHQADFNRLSEEQKQKIMEHHGMTIKLNE